MTEIQAVVEALLRSGQIHASPLHVQALIALGLPFRTYTLSRHPRRIEIIELPADVRADFETLARARKLID